MVAQCFKSCALTLPVDGSQDHLIHCFKDKQQCEARSKMLKEQMALFNVNTNPVEGVTDSDVDEAADLNYLIDSDHGGDEEMLLKYSILIFFPCRKNNL